jgi:hypothetical protein
MPVDPRQMNKTTTNLIRFFYFVMALVLAFLFPPDRDASRVR